MVMEAGIEQLAELSGVPQARLAPLLALLKAPDDLPQLLLVMTNLKRALQAVEGTPDIRKELDDDDGEGRGLFDYLPEIGRIIASLSATDLSTCPEGWLDKSGRQRGIINAHPEWAMLILTQGAECYDSDTYWQHAGVILACCALQRKRHRELIGSEITAACRDIRTTANGKKPLELLTGIGSDATLETYHQEHLLEGDEILEPLSGVELLVRKVLRFKGKTREGGGGRTR